jgi:hypothetical protein
MDDRYILHEIYYQLTTIKAKANKPEMIKINCEINTIFMKFIHVSV